MSFSPFDKQNQIQADKKKAEAAKALTDAAKYGAQEKKLGEQYKTARNNDLAEGRARGEQIFGNEALGRLGGTGSAVNEVLQRRQAALGGYTPEQQQAMREQNVAEINRNAATGARSLARSQATSGVRGALASAQQGAFQQANQKQLADQERSLYLSNIAEQNNALDKYEQTGTATEQFNLGQQNKELEGKLATEMGYGSLGSAERAAAVQSVLGDKALASSKEIAAAQGKK